MKKLLLIQAKTMLSMQHAMNSKVDPEWITARYPYLRAVVIEGAEAIEHHGWKWWKHQQHDLLQLQMELIDIWHFMLSDMLLTCQGDQVQATRKLFEMLSNTSDNTLFFDGKKYLINTLDLVEKLELLIGTSVARRIEVSLFEAIMRDCQMNWEELFRQYVGKNVLNFFRQDHGYKEGTYRKTWNEREDNEHLVDVLETLDPHAHDYQELIYQALQERYKGSHSPA